MLHLEERPLLYLDRYWREEVQVCADLLARRRRRRSTRPPGRAASTGSSRSPGYDEQREAAALALAQRTTVLTGGPGTGKTTTVAGLLALLAEQAEPPAHPGSGSPWPPRPARRRPGCSRRSRSEVGQLPRRDRPGPARRAAAR